MLAKLHCERVGVLIMGVAVWAGGMTSTPGPRGDQVHRFSNDGVVTLPGDMAAWTRCRNDPAFVAPLAPFFDSIMLGRRFHVGRSASGGLQGRVPREHVRAHEASAVDRLARVVQLMWMTSRFKSG